jgi:hypothetical protein
VYLAGGDSRTGEKIEFNMDHLSRFGAEGIDYSFDFNIWFLSSDQKKRDKDAHDERCAHDEKFK